MSTSAIVAIIAVTIMVVYILVKYWRYTTNPNQNRKTKEYPQVA